MERLPATTPSVATLVGSALALCFLVANAKSLPFAHSLRLLPSLYRLLRPRLSTPKPKDGPPPSNPTTNLSPTVAAAATTNLFRHHTTHSRAVLFDLDVNMHKSNSTFFADADINRAELLTRRLGRGGLAAAMPLLAAVQCTFKREIAPFQAYDVSSRLLAWDERSLFVVTYFLKAGVRLPAGVELAGGPAAVLGDTGLRRCVYAVMVTRYVCKAGRETVKPAAVLEAAGLLVSGAGAEVTEKGGDAGLLAADDVGVVVKSGMQYVNDCMV